MCCRQDFLHLLLGLRIIGRSMDVDRIAAAADLILEYSLVLIVRKRHSVFSVNAAGFPHTEQTGGRDQYRMFKSGDMFPEKFLKFMDDAAALPVGIAPVMWIKRTAPVDVPEIACCDRFSCLFHADEMLFMQRGFSRIGQFRPDDTVAASGIAAFLVA